MVAAQNAGGIVGEKLVISIPEERYGDDLQCKGNMR